MEGVAYRYLSDFAASVDIDALMGSRREAFNREIKDRIQGRLDELGVGIEIVLAGIRGAHPPSKSKVAAAFQSVISARTNMEAITNSAEKEELKILTRVAGTKARADELDNAIQMRDALRSDPEADPEALAESERHVEDLLTGNADEHIVALSGEAGAQIAQSKAEAAKRIGDAASKVRSFSADVAAYEAAPALYKQRKRIGIYENLDNIRKFLITGDPGNVIIEYETREEGGLDRVLRERTE
jgi:regulator of protease activity HflC (stomatin/prohibitin superfamily)